MYKLASAILVTKDKITFNFLSINYIGKLIIISWKNPMKIFISSPQQSHKADVSGKVQLR